ncbi:MAG TPA: DUF6600 domain-containing protein [Candidatus Baltobacteraceae bacterium]|nr:DUF6600 domain-containing protein [Candidatus Baltobacteraceae bacterium]
MITSQLRRAIGGLLATALALGATLTATRPAVAQYAVPGAPGVADVSVVQGDVVIVRGDSGAQVGATINTPMLPGDYISTAGGSRAEVQFDGISMIRLAGDTQVRIVNLDPGSREVQLASGTAELAVLQDNAGGSQIDTPSVTVRPARAGDYRVSVMSNGETLVTVRSGMANVSSGNGSENLTPGSTLIAYGNYNAAQVSMQAAIGYDSFDNFNQRRDQNVVASYNSDRYLAPALAGYADFSNYGQWHNVPGYGESWSPSNQANNWSPYSNGQWVWEPGYGYTWVGNESWGYVPYHYGNWYYAQGYNQWMWQPPNYQYQNPNALSSAWLPALVAFFLTGGNGNAAPNAAFDPYQPYGYGNIGWVPLAPGEQYQPWYSGFGANAVFPQTALRPENVTNVYNVYRNIRYVKVVRVISVRQFRDGDFSHPVMLPAREVRQLTLVRGAVPVVPTKSVLGVRQASTTVRLSPRFEQPVFAKKAPAIVHVTSFDREATALRTAVATKPRVEAAPVRTTTVAHPVYQAPVESQTFKAPVQVTKPAPRPQAKPETKPQFVPPEQRHVAPERTAAPERTLAPSRTPEAQRFVPPEQRMPPHAMTPPPQQRATPQAQQEHHEPKGSPSPAPL